MHGQQCNTCGGFEKLDVCLHCKTAVCTSCKQSHEPYCQVAQKIRKMGGGPTIANTPQSPHRAGHETPADAVRYLSMPAVLGASYDLSVPSLDIVPVVPVEPIDQAIDATQELLEGK